MMATLLMLTWRSKFLKLFQRKVPSTFLGPSKNDYIEGEVEFVNVDGKVDKNNEFLENVKPENKSPDYTIQQRFS